LNNQPQAVAVALPNPNQDNLAPVKVLEELRQSPDALRKTFTEFVNATCQNYEADRAEVWREILSGIELTSHFIAGNQSLMRGHRTGRWRVVRQMNNTADPVAALPKLGMYVGQLITAGVNGRADCDVIPGDDTEESKGGARKGQAVLDWLEDEIYKERFIQSEILAGITSGLKVRYYRWSTDGDWGFAERPVYGEQPVNMPGGYYCPTCETGGETPQEEAAEGPMHEAMESPQEEAAEHSGAVCPQCGGATIATPGAQTTVPVQTGTQKVKRGRPVCESVFLTQIRWNLAVPLEKSHWLRYEQNLPKEQIRAALPGVNLDKAFEETKELVNEMSERLASSTPFWVGQGGRTNKGTHATLVTWWLDPCTYAGLELKEQLETLSGQVIPAGTKYADVWPKGMCLVTLKGVKHPVAVFNEHHADHWVSAPYHIKLLSGLGNGIGEAVEAQRQWNLLMGLIFTQIRTAATPGMLYQKGRISSDDADLIGSAGMNIPVDAADDGSALSAAVYQVPAQPLPNQVPWYVGQLDNLMQSGTQALAFSGAIPGVNNDTYGGAQIGANLAQSMHDPIMALQADMDERGAQIMLRLWQENAIDAYWVPKVGERDNYEGEWFSALDVGGELRVKARPGSWRARSDMEKRESFEQALNATVAFGGVMMTPPKILKQISDLYGVDFAHDQYSAQARLCRIRINQIKELLPTFEQALEMMMQLMPAQPMPNSEGTSPEEEILLMIAAQLVGMVKPSIDPEEPGHLDSIEYLREWYLDDEGIEASRLFRKCVSVLIQSHLAAYSIEQGIAAQAQAVSADMQINEAQQDQQQQREIERTPNQKKTDGAKKNSKASAGKPASKPPQRQQAAAA